MYHIPPGPRGGGNTNRGGRGAGRGGAGGGRGGGRGGSGGNRGSGANRGNAFKRGGGGRGGNRGGAGGNRGGGGPVKRGGNKAHPGGGAVSNASSANSSASNLFSSLCTVCNDKPAKYRCITCRAPYCSLLCNNNHKKTPCTPNSYINASGNRNPNDMDDDDDDNEQAGDKFEPKPMQSFLGPLLRNVKSVPGLPSSVLIEEEERNARVPLSRLMRLVHTDAILDSLSSSALRDLITSIDSAPNDGIRENRLKHALAQPQFAQFADLCLDIIRKPDLSTPATPATAAAAAAPAPDTSLAFAMDMAPDWQKQKWGMDVDDDESDESEGDSGGDSDGDDHEAGSNEGKQNMDVDPEAGGNAAEDGDDVAVEDGEEEGEIVLVG